MSIWRRLKFLLPFYRRAAERDIHEELDALAAIAGRRELGNRTLAAENARAEWDIWWLEQLGQDIRYGFRTLRLNPGFTAVAVLSLGLGIGVTAAMFSAFDAVFLR